MVQGRLDYCNAVLYATSAAKLHKLQRIQNSLARIVTGTYKHEHITPVLAKLHWLPVYYRIQFKIAVITFKALTTQQPRYLSELLQIHVPHRHLRSVDAERLAIPRTKLKFTNRAFSHAAPTIWNGLAVCRSALSTVTLSQFKRLVKSELYNRAFDNI